MEPSPVTHLPSPAPTSTSTEVPPRPHLVRMHSSTWRRTRGVSTGGWRAWLLPAHCGGLQTPSSCCVLGGPPTPSRSQQAARAAHLAVHGGRPGPPPPNVRAKMAGWGQPSQLEAATSLTLSMPLRLMEP